MTDKERQFRVITIDVGAPYPLDYIKEVKVMDFRRALLKNCPYSGGIILQPNCSKCSQQLPWKNSHGGAMECIKQMCELSLVVR